MEPLKNRVDGWLARWRSIGGGKLIGRRTAAGIGCLRWGGGGEDKGRLTERQRPRFFLRGGGSWMWGRGCLANGVDRGAGRRRRILRGGGGGADKFISSVPAV